MKKVTSQQIDYLYKFTQENNVKYYDVQTELVDHLANAIEAHWQTKPNAKFEYVLMQEIQKFGAFGFKKVTEEKEKQLRKRYNKIIFNEIISFFSFPKIVITIGLIIIIFGLLSFFQNSFSLSILILMGYLIIGIFFLVQHLVQRKYKHRERKWIFTDVIFDNSRRLAGLVLVLEIFTLLIFNLEEISKNQYILLIIAIVSVLFYLLGFLMFFHIPKNSEKYLSEIYPEYQTEIAKS